jgi:hypothetical protein
MTTPTETRKLSCFFFAKVWKLRLGLEVVGLDAQSEAGIDFVVEAAAGDQNATSSDLDIGAAAAGGESSGAPVSVENFADWRPTFIFAAGKLSAKEDVVLASLHVECGVAAGAEDIRASSETARAMLLGNLGGSEKLAALDDEAEPVGGVQGERGVPAGQSGPVAGVEEPGLGIGATGEELVARILDPRERRRFFRRLPGMGVASGIRASATEVEPVVELAWGPAPTRSRTARPQWPKLRGISSRFLLQVQHPAPSQPRKGRLNSGGLRYR